MECRWRAYQKDVRDLMNRTTSAPARARPEELELNWSSDLGPLVERFAKSMAFPRLKGRSEPRTSAAKHKSHVSKKEQGLRSPQQNAAEDSQYRKLMGFSADELKALKPVLF